MRRPHTLEWQVPPEPAALWAVRAVQAFAALVLLHWGFEWALVLLADADAGAGLSLQGSGVVEGVGSGYGFATGVGVAALVMLFTLAGWLARRALRRHAPSWALRVDGEGWHWAGGEGHCAGSGMVQVAVAFGPWCLLRAVAQPGQGQSAWIWLRPARLGSPDRAAWGDTANTRHLAGTRLRTALNWP